MYAVKFENISKKYNLGSTVLNLRDAIPNAINRLLRREEHRNRKYIWALKDINFKIKSGEAFGIIGPNGAGKTTILKLISHIIAPTEGNIDIKGRVASLIELGAGFHPDLSGQENIYLYGSIMGLKQREINKSFDSIVDFAEIEQFLETPLKRYSSGMKVRLGFSVISHIDCDVLIVDEVLAVGDMSFRVKCQNRMKQFRDSGKTIVFVSHNLNAVQSICNRTLYLHKGVVKEIGETGKVIRNYIETTNKAQVQKGAERSERWGTGEIEIKGVLIYDSNDRQIDSSYPNDKIKVRMLYYSNIEAEDVDFRLVFKSAEGVDIILASSARAGKFYNVRKGTGEIDFVFDKLPLWIGSYSITATISSTDGRKDYDIYPAANTFSVSFKNDFFKKNIPLKENFLVTTDYNVFKRK